MKSNIEDVKRMQELAGIIKEGETITLSGFQYFTDKDEWWAKVKELYPNYEDYMTVQDTGYDIGIRLTRGKGMGAVSLGGWSDNPELIYTDPRTKIKYPGAVNINKDALYKNLVYPDGSRMD